MELPRQKTKIIATIGPNSNSEKVLKRMIKKGMNIARINFAHGDFDEHRELIKRIKKVSNDLGRKVAILGDLPGIKIRVAELENEPMKLEKGKTYVLTTEDIIGKGNKIPVNVEKFPELISEGDEITLSDGYIRMRAEKIEGKEVFCKVLVSGQLFSRKGINIPKTNLDLEAVTERDLKILDFAIDQDIDAIGVSFAGSARDVMKVKKVINEKKEDFLIVSKIERPDAVNNFDEILEVSDGIMVARGDLGIETRIEKLPVLQKKLIQKTNVQGKPVITATQMLQSMTEDKIPTRAEVTDVSNAILDGTDAVMLSEETAIGEYPVKAVETMSKIAVATEKYRRTFGHKRISDWKDEISEKGTIKQAITHSIIEALGVINIDLILIPSNTGRTARLISRFKPNQWILAFPDQKTISQQLMFSYGIYPICAKEGATDQELINLTKENGLVESGDKVLLTSGRPIENTSGTNAIKTFTIS